jgi:2-iminobutanoate/2-iminopropanoate deaminase
VQLKPPVEVENASFSVSRKTHRPVRADNRVLDNLEAILKGAGCSLADVVKVTVFMTDLGDFAKLNDTLAARFGNHRPARTTVQVAKLPAGAALEMDMVARVPH